MTVSSLIEHHRHLCLIFKVTHAGPAYEAAAILENEDWDAYQLFDAAYHAYHGTRPDDAARCLQELIRFYTKDGNYRSAAPKQELLGDLYAEKSQDYDKAIEAWQKAGNWYKNNQSAAWVSTLTPDDNVRRNNKG